VSSTKGNPRIAELGRPYRFQKGKATGRPKGTGITDRLIAALEEVVTAPDGKGKNRRMTNAELIARAMIKAAIGGDVQAATLIWNRVEGKVPDLLVTTDNDTFHEAAAIIRARIAEREAQDQAIARGEHVPGFSSGEYSVELLPPQFQPAPPEPDWQAQADAELAVLLGPARSILNGHQ
jgi:hypothetical protein